MGCDIHAVLQEKQDKEWVTVIEDVITGRDYELFGFLSNVRGAPIPSWTGIATDGFPMDFKVDANNVHGDNDFFMGEHSFGHINVEEFITQEYPHKPPSIGDKFMVEKFEHGYWIEFMEAEEIDYAGGIRALQQGLRILLGHGAQNFRLVFGYDS